MSSLAIPLLIALPTASLTAEDLGGGRAASHGRVPRFVLERWIPGAASALTFQDLPPNTVATAAILSSRRTNITLPGIGTLIADAGAPGAIVLAMGTTLPIAQLPIALQNQQLVIQGAVLDASAGALLTDATLVDLFNPRVMVGNQRQSANSISVIDLPTRAVVDRLGNSENGRIAWSPDRRYAYVCEPGSQRNRVVVYDLTASPIPTLTTIPVSGGIRYRGAITRDGRRMYVPLHNAIAIVDTDPSSTTFHTEIGTIPTPITGNPSTIFTGPIDVAVTPDGSKLYVAYGETITYPGPSTVGVIDLNLPGTPHRAIAVTTGGVVSLGGDLATRTAIVVSADGQWVYALEFGFPASPLTKGFVNGALVNVISAAADIEITTVATGGIGQQEMALDRLGRNLWIPQTAGNLGQVLQIDVDRHSPTRFTVRNTIPVDPTPYSGGGPQGISTTPDGALVAISVAEDAAHPVPQLVTYDVLLGQLTGAPITVESLCATVAIQQR